MKCIVWETGDIASNKAEAIKKARCYLEKHPEQVIVSICKKDGITHWFDCGREKVYNARNFVKI